MPIDKYSDIDVQRKNWVEIDQLGLTALKPPSTKDN
jgi:hypothetical protein